MADLAGILGGPGMDDGTAVVPDGLARAFLTGTAGAAAARAVKRGMDVVAATMLLVVTAPVLLCLALLVRATSAGPAFFRQERVGQSGRRFRILKVRTMVADAERRLRQDARLRETYRAHNFKLPPSIDPRLTPVGRFIRRTSLDELPQLMNVLRGDMSLVGPRPVVPDELEQYADVAALYERMRPGITGWWQVQGRSEIIGTDRVALDRYYLEHWTLWLDVKIMLRTIPAVLRCRGAQ